MSLESKDATCVGSLCERANSHGTRDFASDTDLQAPFHKCEMRYVRTLKGLSLAPVNLVTREMARSVKANISVEHAELSHSLLLIY